MNFGVNIENCNLAIEKAKIKKDGIYTFRGFLYRVKNNRVTHWAYYGQILENCGNFNVIVGSYDCYSYATQHSNNIHSAGKMLKEIQ